jgi:hypothetical protein
MHNKMTRAARAELANAIRHRYQSASGKRKHKILDEFVATTGYREKSAIRELDGQPPAKRRQTRKRPSICNEAAGSPAPKTPSAQKCYRCDRNAPWNLWWSGRGSNPRPSHCEGHLSPFQPFP